MIHPSFCECERCRSEKLQALVFDCMLLLVVAFLIVWVCDRVFDAFSPLACKAQPASITPVLHAALPGAGDQNREGDSPCVAPSMAGVRIGASLFVSSWRWRLRRPASSDPRITGDARLVYRRRVRVAWHHHLARPWCARESDNA
jgi:hypothetical protein